MATPLRLRHHAGALWASRAPVWTAMYPELGEVVERLLRMSLRGAEKVTAVREDESFDRWYLPRAVTAPPNGRVRCTRGLGRPAL